MAATKASLADRVVSEVQLDTVVAEDSSTSADDEPALRTKLIYCEECTDQATDTLHGIVNDCVSMTGICEMPDEAEWQRVSKVFKAEAKIATNLLSIVAPELKEEWLKTGDGLEDMRQVLKACVEDRSQCSKLKDEFQKVMQSVKDLYASTNKALSLETALRQRAAIRQSRPRADRAQQLAQQMVSLDASVLGKCGSDEV